MSLTAVVLSPQKLVILSVAPPPILTVGVLENTIAIAYAPAGRVAAAVIALSPVVPVLAVPASITKVVGTPFSTL